VTSGRRGGHDFRRTETKVERGINAFAEGVADNPTAIFVIKRNTDCGDCVVRLADTPNVEPEEELPSVVLLEKKKKNLKITCESGIRIQPKSVISVSDPGRFGVTRVVSFWWSEGSEGPRRIFSAADPYAAHHRTPARTYDKSRIYQNKQLVRIKPNLEGRGYFNPSPQASLNVHLQLIKGP